MIEDTRNVIDKFKGMATAKIKEILKGKAYPYAVCMSHLYSDYNLSTLTRNANAFGAREVYYYGVKRVDARGFVGVNHYTDITYLESVYALKSLKEKYFFIGVDNIKGATEINDFIFPKQPVLFLFGEEKAGLQPEILEMCDSLIYLKQYGSVRSLNTACASLGIMKDYTSRITNNDWSGVMNNVGKLIYRKVKGGF